MIGFPTNQYSPSQYEKALRDVGCPGEICLVELESGKFSGEIVFKLQTEEEKNAVLNMDLSNIAMNIARKEIGANVYYKCAKKTGKKEGDRNLFLRFKGMDWSVTEDDIHRFLPDVSIVELIMTKTPTGRPTGEAYLMLETEADTELAKKQNRKYLGRRFVVIEEVFEEQFNMAKSETGFQPKPIAHNPNDYIPKKLRLKNLTQDTTAEDIKAFFQNKGAIDVEVEEFIESAESGSQKIAVILMNSDEDVNVALSMHNSVLNKNKINLEKIRKTG